MVPFLTFYSAVHTSRHPSDEKKEHTSSLEEKKSSQLKLKKGELPSQKKGVNFNRIIMFSFNQA
jgi:hypothetical protein